MVQMIFGRKLYILGHIKMFGTCLFMGKEIGNMKEKMGKSIRSKLDG